MNLTNRWDKILELLRAGNLEMVAHAFDRAAHEEANVLMQKDGGRKRTQAFREELLRDARDLYARDVLDFLRTERALDPTDVLFYQRRSVAWAVAAMIRQHVKPEALRAL